MRFPLVINRYLISELMKTFTGVLLVLVMILLANSFVRILGKVAAGQLGNDVLGSLLGLELLKVLGFLVPPAFFFAVLISLGRLYRDSEMIAMQSSGVGPATIYRAYLLAALPVALLVGYLVLGVLPWAKLSLLQMQAEQKTVQAELSMVGTGRFQEFNNGQLVFYAEAKSKESDRIRNVFIQNRQQGREGVVVAKEGYQYVDEDTGDHFVVLLNGRRYTGEPGRRDWEITRFEEYGLRIRRAEAKQSSLPMSARPTSRLWISDDLNEQTELQYRLSFPLAVIALTLISIPLARSMPRQGVYGRLFLAILVYFLFMNLQRLAESWMEKGDSPLWLGMWWVPLLFAVIALVLEYRDQQMHRIYLRRRQWLDMLRRERT